MGSTENKIRIVIADDHPLFLRGIKYSLLSENNIEIIGEASNGAEALELVKELIPDIAILDYDMPEHTGLEILEEIRKNNISTKIIFLTMHSDSEIFEKAINLKADGFLLKDSIDTEIMKSIKTVINGGNYYDPMLSGSLIKEKVIEKSKEMVTESLTKTERRIIKLVASNKTTQEIADKLFVSTRTVDRHRSNICKKLNVSGHNALMHFVIENKHLIT